MARDFNAIKHRHLLLMADDVAAEDTDPHRPNLSLWADEDESANEKPGRVIVAMQALWGQPYRYAEMTPDEARRLAAMLKQTADAVDAVEENRAEAAYMRHQEHLMETGGGPSLRDQQIEAMKLK